jgi:ligand-binding sensor domain-containing protein
VNHYRRSLSDKIPVLEGPYNKICFPGVSLICILKLFISGLLISMTALSELNASQDNLRIINYIHEQGLSQVSVSSIIQDSHGFLWIGTQDGLNRFDGYGFNVYRHQPSDPSSLSGSNVHSVIEDSKGNIWVGTQAGLNKLDRKRNSFMVYRHEPENLSSVSDDNIYYLFEDRDGTIWLKTERGIDRFDPVTGTFKHYQHYTNDSNYVTGSGYYHIYEDNKDRLWVGSKDGLFYFDRLAERFRRYSHDPDNPLSISNNKVKCIFETSEGHFLIGTAGGLNIFDRINESFASVYIDTPATGKSGFNVINTIFEDSRGNIWLGTDSGLFTFSPEDGQILPFGGKAISGTFLDMEVSVIFEDHSNNLWVGSLGGLFMIDSKSKFASIRIHDYLPEAPSSASLIASVLSSKDEELWIGTWGGGLFMLNKHTGDIKHYSANSPIASNRISNDFVHALFSDSRGRIIIGTRNGLDIYLGDQIGFEPFCPTNQEEECTVFNSNRVYRIFEDSQQVLWIGTGRGLHSVSEGNIKSYYHNPQDTAGIPSSQVTDILECRNGFIWLATGGGLSRFDRTTETFSNYRKDPEKGRFSLSNNELTCLHEDSNGNLWIGSVAGLNRFFPGTGSFMVLSEMEGLPNNLIYAILEDNEGNLWLSTNRGLARFNPDSFEIDVFDVADGLLSYEFNLGAGFRGENGELFFGGVAGLNSFFPDSLVTNNIIPPVAITSFEVLSPEGNWFILAEETEEIILRPRENSFIIEFAAMDFTRPYKNRYAYKLPGLENNWIYTGSRRTVSFSRVPSGSYILRVKGSNNDGVWNEEGVSLRIVIITPWWKSGYAYVLYVVSLLAFVYLAIMVSTRKLRSTNQH